MSTAAVIGSPVSHSRSPAIFSFVAARMGQRDFRYQAIDVKADQLPSFARRLRQETGWVGVNVTSPLKEAGLPFVDTLSPEARAIGAINVVRVNGGRLAGDNTDVAGVARTLVEQGCDVAGKNVWVFGAGGAARAVLYALGQLEARQVLVTNRDPAQARRVCAALAPVHPGTALVPLPAGDAPREQVELVVNASSAGMTGVPEDWLFAPLEQSRATDSALAFDLVYAPTFTPFLRRAKEMGFRTVGGLDMLVHQALRTWELWMGGDAAALKAPIAEHLFDGGVP